MKNYNQEFTISVHLSDKLRHINVRPKETTDGVAYFGCFLDKKEITQLRKELYGHWEQLWGNLDAATIESIGKEIEKKVLS
ncbi:MAG: hypothetical protein V4541_00750 [Bacteroidota bacterium]